MVKNMLYFAAGALLGSGIQYILMRRKVQREIDKLNEEMTELRKKEKEPKYTWETRKDDTPYSDLMGKPFKPLTAENEKKIMKQYYTSEVPFEEVEDSMEGVAPIPKLEKPAEHPYMISYEIMEAGYPRFEPVSLSAYTDGVVIEDNFGNIIDNPEDLLGDCLEHPELSLTGDPDVILVRNEKYEQDYEVTLMGFDFYTEGDKA